jgi:UDP-glucose 6-dehydrogenase
MTVLMNLLNKSINKLSIIQLDKVTNSKFTNIIKDHLQKKKKCNERSISQLGIARKPNTKDVKPYLDEFLMDKYVDVPYLLRALLVRGVILQKTRPKKSAATYAC